MTTPATSDDIQALLRRIKALEKIIDERKNHDPGAGITDPTFNSLTLSGDVLHGSNALSNIRMRTMTIADNAVAQLFHDAGETYGAIVFIIDTGGGYSASFTTRREAHQTFEVMDANGAYSVTAGTAGAFNIYWSATNSRYEIENKRGTTRTLSIFYLAGG